MGTVSIRDLPAVPDAAAVNDADIVHHSDITTDQKLSMEILAEYVLLYSPKASVISTQEQFNSIIERVATNQYKIIDALEFVRILPLSGGYNFKDGTTGPLSGGDTWGYIETNNCKNIDFVSGTYIDVGDTQAYMEINTDDAVLKNVEIRGLGSSSIAIAQSFLLNALRILYDNCKTSDRLSSTNFTAFRGSGTANHNRTSKYRECIARDLDSDGGTTYGYSSCQNLDNCSAEAISSNADNAIGFNICDNLNNCTAYNITHDGAVSGKKPNGFLTCTNLSSCVADDINNDSADQAEAFAFCKQLSACKAVDVDGTGGNAVGFRECEQLSACTVITLDVAGGDFSIGFDRCLRLSGCLADDLDAPSGTSRGYNSCDILSGCEADNINGNAAAEGFISCDILSACKAGSIVSGAGTAEGFKGCNYGSSLFTAEAINSGNDWIDTIDTDITNKVSTPSVWI